MGLFWNRQKPSHSITTEDGFILIRLSKDRIRETGDADSLRTLRRFQESNHGDVGGSEFEPVACTDKACADILRIINS